MSITIIDEKISRFWRKPIIFLIIVCGISLLIRLHYLSNLPLTLDSLDYFFYASDISINQKLPENYTPANNGWPIFLSGFFSLVQFDNVISYMHLQRILSIILSTITIIPIFFLCKKFVGSKLSLMGAVIFAFEPRLIQNSLLGITDPLYIFLITMTLVTFLESKKLMYASFAFAALASIVRSEGVMLFLLILILSFIKFKNQKNEIPKIILAVGIFFLIVTPMMYYKSDVIGNDLIFGRVSNAVSTYEKFSMEAKEISQNPYIIGIENFSKYFVWNLIPIFVFFVPLGMVFLFKKINFNKIFIILGLITFSIPAFWAYSIPLQDTRYLYFMYPFLILISLYVLEKISIKKYSNLILSLIIVGILSSSLIFLEFKMDYNHEKESYLIAKEISKNFKVANSFPPESKFIEVMKYPEKWNDFIPYFKTDRQQNVSIRNSLQDIQLIDSKKFENVKDLIKNADPKLTHIIVDDTFDKNDYLYKIYENEENYPFLEKEYDSKKHNFKYHVKMYKINFDEFYKNNFDEK